jgi:rod shape-determining protein MreD
MRHAAILLVSFLLLAFESPLLGRVRAEAFAPDLLLIVVLYVGLTTRLEKGLVLALVLGLLKDGFTLGTPIGMHMELLVLAFLVTFRMSRRLALRSPLGVVLLTIFFSLGSGLVELALALVFDRDFGVGARDAELILKAMIPQALVTAPFGPRLFWLFDRLDRVMTRQGASFYVS